MRKLAVLGGIALVAVAGCATTTSSDNTASAQCQYYSRTQGLEWVRDVKSEAVSDGTAVTMKVKDGLSREFEATCIYAAGKPPRWAAPLPSNVVTRGAGGDTMSGPAKQ